MDIKKVCPDNYITGIMEKRGGWETGKTGQTCGVLPSTFVGAALDFGGLPASLIWNG
jgi:hypothetical protein